MIMHKTAPFFYKIPVTRDLLYNIAIAKYPETPTIVEWCFPPVPNTHAYVAEGMKVPENRRVVLQCLKAFRELMMDSSKILPLRV